MRGIRMGTPALIHSYAGHPRSPSCAVCGAAPPQNRLGHGSARHYYEPLFKTRCECVGKEPSSDRWTAVVDGQSNSAHRRRQCDLIGVTTFVGTKLIDDPLPGIGSDPSSAIKRPSLPGRGSILSGMC
jgi:hypothetical protein